MQTKRKRKKKKPWTPTNKKRQSKKGGVHPLDFLQIEKEVQEKNKEKAIPSLNPLGPYKKKDWSRNANKGDNNNDPWPITFDKEKKEKKENKNKNKIK